jgi:hypothetical protein
VRYLPIFHPRIEADVRSAMASYDERSPGLGERFKRTFYATVEAVLIFPLKDAVKLDGVIRTRLMRPFPYLIFYVAENATVFVLTVQYAGRKPALSRGVARERSAE